jgi:hypothetical protein
MIDAPSEAEYRRPPSAKSDITIRSSDTLRDRVSSTFPSVYFLDFELYQRTGTEIPRALANIPRDIQEFTEDIREQARLYFTTIHPWFPFLSRKSFNERLLSPFNSRGLDVTALFASIKLVCSVPGGKIVCTNAYTSIKCFLIEAEVAGLLSIRILQSWILLCLYEYSHAIFPAAYVSIGTCARYATALGLNGAEIKIQQRISHSIEAEERVRAWWAILILDR